MATLSWYQNDASVLLRDQAYAFNSKAQLTRWINEARRNIAKRTGCVRRLVTGQSGFGAGAQPGFAIPGGMQPGALVDNVPALLNTVANQATQNSFTTIAGVERYPFVGFIDPVLRAQYAGCDSVIDVIACSVNWGGNFRPTLNWMPWDDLQAWCRSYSNQTTAYPSVWSVYNDGTQGEIWLFPTPSQIGEMEIDCYCTPKALNSDDDFDVIPDGFKEAVKFMAASLAFMTSYRYQEAQMMERMYLDSIGVAATARDMGKSPSYYYTSI